MVYLMATESLTPEQRAEFDAGLVPPPPPSPDELERKRQEHIEAIVAAGGEVTVA